MKHSAALKMMGLAGALVSLGVFAADDSRTKDMNKGKADASFVEEAATSSVTEIKMSELAVSQSTNTAVRELAQQMIDDHTKAFESLKGIAQNKGIMLPFDSVGSSGTTGSSSKTGAGGKGAAKSTGASSGTGESDTLGSNVGHGNTASPGSSAEVESGVSEPAASGEGRMGSGDRMNTEPKNVYGQLPTSAQRKYDDLAKLTGEKFDKEYLGNIVDAHKKAIKVFEKESKSGEDSDLKGFASNTLPTLKHHLDMAEAVQRDLKAKKPNM